MPRQQDTKRNRKTAASTEGFPIAFVRQTLSDHFLDGRLKTAIPPNDTSWVQFCPWLTYHHGQLLRTDTELVLNKQTVLTFSEAPPKSLAQATQPLAAAETVPIEASKDG